MRDVGFEIHRAEHHNRDATIPFVFLDAFGHVHSDAMHITERLRRRDFGHMDVEITVDDPKAYTKPFTIKLTQQLLPDTDVLEYFCTENEKDVQHLAIK